MWWERGRLPGREVFAKQGFEFFHLWLKLGQELAAQVVGHGRAGLRGHSPEALGDTGASLARYQGSQRRADGRMSNEESAQADAACRFTTIVYLVIHGDSVINTKELQDLAMDQSRVLGKLIKDYHVDSITAQDIEPCFEWSGTRRCLAILQDVGPGGGRWKSSAFSPLGFGLKGVGQISNIFVQRAHTVPVERSYLIGWVAQHDEDFGVRLKCQDSTSGFR